MPSSGIVGSRFLLGPSGKPSFKDSFGKWSSESSLEDFGASAGTPGIKDVGWFKKDVVRNKLELVKLFPGGVKAEELLVAVEEVEGCGNDMLGAPSSK